ncbi:putative membrane protein [Saccharopolyspora lacisalsi]|uniref:Putative membrane protein n=1 Tax=Halosaccharopolyspora lacisalsi TaxID=1000566 RepID=A0A839E0X9_9PSEU|nr:heparan-alpha-glucosaminide N-acetyltransferase domain-containing protein [Halosaccharopolyspora lacisalsi]MBA8825335.1 putative membrane protein [Halosaccharopolyspora lacisalsi]
MTASTSAEQASAKRPGRLIGIDLARFLAVLGMFCVHFGVPFAGDELTARVFEISSGRATGLFTFLAGVSLSMMSGRRRIPTGADLHEARKRIAIRAVLMIVLGLALVKATDATGFLLTVIIPFYGTYFMLSLPFIGMRPRGLLISAATVGALGPQVAFLLRTWLTPNSPLSTVTTVVDMLDPGHRLAEIGLLDTLLLGFYPAMSYFALVLAGMAVGRMDLRATGLRAYMAACGALIAFLSYTVSDRLLRALGGSPDAVFRGPVSVDQPETLLSSMAHTGTSFELFGAFGVSLLVLAGCLEVADRLGRLLFPLVAAGSMALTLYTVHALVLAWQVVVGGWPLHGVEASLAELATMPPGAEDVPGLPAFPADGELPTGFIAWVNAYMPEVFLIGSLVFATAWQLKFRRGPLEAAISESIRWLSDPQAALTAQSAKHSGNRG